MSHNQLIINSRHNSIEGSGPWWLNIFLLPFDQLVYLGARAHLFHTSIIFKLFLLDNILNYTTFYRASIIYTFFSISCRFYWVQYKLSNLSWKLNFGTSNNKWDPRNGSWLQIRSSQYHHAITRIPPFYRGKNEKATICFSF